eukprot:TRINITY_DN8945_c0_g2_i1.p2 TRINITY_DN8945_c0_g2~~TRINITY_DN8945_c0_g2_i1.p2  ORF type:complete len:403 (-),score=132.05 TRINITY_DN8945_c0_g2_i1:2420-3628(-)
MGCVGCREEEEQSEEARKRDLKARKRVHHSPELILWLLEEDEPPRQVNAKLFESVETVIKRTAPMLGVPEELCHKVQLEHNGRVLNRALELKAAGVLTDDEFKILGAEDVREKREQALEVDLWEASLKADTSAVQLVCDYAAERLNESDESQQTVLHRAANEGHLDVVKLLLKHKANTDVRDYYLSTPLHRASYNGHHKIAEELLDYKAPVDARNMSRSTPLHLAAYTGHKKVVQALLRGEAAVEAQDESQSTALHIAARFGHYKVLQKLLDADADVNARAGFGHTPLFKATQHEHSAVVTVLREHGALEEAPAPPKTPKSSKPQKQAPMPIFGGRSSEPEPEPVVVEESKEEEEEGSVVSSDIDVDAEEEPLLEPALEIQLSQEAQRRQTGDSMTFTIISV